MDILKNYLVQIVMGKKGFSFQTYYLRGSMVSYTKGERFEEKFVEQVIA